jgi:hypothetical protein
VIDLSRDDDDIQRRQADECIDKKGQDGAMCKKTRADTLTLVSPEAENKVLDYIVAVRSNRHTRLI